MIVQAVLNILLDFADWIINLFPDVNAPAWLSGVGGPLGDVTSHLAGFGTWIPFSAAGNALTFVAACIGIALVVKVVRIVVSLFTGGGGGAA